jgi:diguanylate cyclase (GGDEF)-like protein
MNEIGPELPPEEDPRVLGALRLQELEDLSYAKDAEISELKEYIKRSEEADLIDEISGAASRKAYTRAIDRVRADYSKLGHDTITVIVADLNNIKAVNDTFNHAIGNDHMRDFVDSLGEAGISRREVFRVHERGDEFTILVPNDSPVDEMMAKTKELFVAKALEEGRITALPTDFEYAYEPITEGALEAAVTKADENLAQKKRDRDPELRYRRLPGEEDT